MPKAKFTANFQGNQILGKVSIKSDNLNFVSIGEDDNATLTSLFDVNKNPLSVHNYADGTHAAPEKIARKISLWGGRETTGDALRAFFVYKNDDADKPIGFVNLGTNQVNINNIEIGIFFDDKTLSNKEGMSLASEAVHVASIEYPEYVKANSPLLPKKQFIFYDASHAPLQQIAKESDFNQINTLNELCTAFRHGTSIDEVKDRFSEQDGKLLDCGRPVLVFFHALEEVEPLGAGSVAAAGFDDTSNV